ncbi:asparagine synthetase B family protein [Stappia sp.]|uniref:asparagine synthetase B family protein n=1 Tax=Stappia sp. TaxID=1870903 RepID=UPI003A99B0AC
MSGIFGAAGSNPREVEDALRTMRHRGALIKSGSAGPFVVASISDDPGDFFSGSTLVAALAGTCFGDDGRMTAEAFARHYQKAGALDFSNHSGHFALAIADGAHDRLILYRDAVGIAPLHVGRGDGRIIFASEYKAILAITRKPEIDTQAVSGFLKTGWTPPGRTFLETIRPVPAGHVCHFRQDQAICNHRSSRRVEKTEKPADPVQAVAGLLRNSVDRMSTECDATEAGLMLSGGVDSALIGGLLKQTLPGKTLRSYTVGYGDDDPEIQGARDTADTLGFQHTEIFLKPADFDRLMPKAVAAMENLGGHDEYPCLLAAHEAAFGKIDVMFSGNLSDTLFAGMNEHRQIWERGDAGSRGGSKDGMLLSAALHKSLMVRDERLSAQEMFAARFGLSARMPYADPDLISLALGLPDSCKVSAQRNKIVLRDVAARTLPLSIANRPKGIQQLRYDEVLRDWLLYRLSLATNNLVKTELPFTHSQINAVRDELRSHITTQTVHAAWNVVAVDFWIREFVQSAHHDLTVT